MLITDLRPRGKGSGNNFGACRLIGRSLIRMRRARGRWCIAHACERHQIYLRSQQRRLFAITYKRRDAHWRWSSLSTRGAMTFPFVYAIRRTNDKSPWILTRSRFASAGSASACTRCPKSILPRILSANTERYIMESKVIVLIVSLTIHQLNLCVIKSQACKRIILHSITNCAVIESQFGNYSLNYLILRCKTHHNYILSRLQIDRIMILSYT